MAPGGVRIGGLTAMELRQIVHSVLCLDSASVPALLADEEAFFASSLRRRCVFLLSTSLLAAFLYIRCGKGVLEVIEAFLPAPVQLHTDLDTAEYHFLPALEIDAQLHNITIVDWIRLRLNPGLTETNVVEKSPGGALNILYEPLIVGVCELAMPPAYNFGFETNGSIRRACRVDVGWSITVGVATDADDAVCLGQCSSHSREAQRRPAGTSVVVRQ